MAVHEITLKIQVSAPADAEVADAVRSLVQKAVPDAQVTVAGRRAALNLLEEGLPDRWREAIRNAQVPAEHDPTDALREEPADDLLARYREALEFYADANNWSGSVVLDDHRGDDVDVDIGGCYAVTNLPDNSLDGSIVACRALGLPEGWTADDR